MADKYIIDLDELADEPIYIKFGGVEHSIPAPDFDEFLKIAKYASVFQNANFDDDSFTDGLQQIRESLGELCPPVKDKKLNLPQMLRLLMGLQEACVPEDVKALDAMGVAPAADGNNSKKES